MAEPISSGAAAGAGGAMAWKAAGGAAGVAAGGAALASLVVMIMTMPNNKREFAVALLSTFICSISLGCYVSLEYLNMAHAISASVIAGNRLEIMMRLASFGGVIFVCGLPGWFFVRAFWLYTKKSKHKDLSDIVAEMRNGKANRRKQRY